LVVHTPTKTASSHVDHQCFITTFTTFTLSKKIPR
jgi:hypothetical protein